MKKKDLERSHRKEPRHLKVELTQDDIRDRGKSLAKVVEDLDETEQARKDSNKTYKDHIDLLKVERTQLRNAIRNGVEYRDVDCVWYTDWAADEIILVREDTSEEVDRKKIPDDWRQTRFFNEED